MPADATLPGTDEDEQSRRIVCHVDMDCFYAACERLREPELEGVPVIVGMGYEAGDDGGVVATASYEAREFGIESAQPISDALDALPRADVMPDDYAGPVGHYRPVDMSYYQKISGQLRSIFDRFATTVRVASLDEAYLDITERTDWTAASSYGARLKTTIADEVGVPASVGIAPTKGVAKIASDHDKPDGLTVVTPDAVASFLEPLPVEDLHGVGPVTAGALREIDLTTIGDVASTPPSVLIEHFGERGRELSMRSRGEGSGVVTPQGKPKSLSRESSLGDPTDDYEHIQTVVSELSEAVAERAEQRGAQYRTIGIKVVIPPFDINTREQTFPGPFADGSLVESTARELLEEFEGETVRKVGVRVSNLDFAADQGSLDEWSDERGDDETTEVTFDHQGRLTDFER